MGYRYYEPQYPSVGATALLTMVTVFAIFACLLLLILQVIAHWKLFQKAGQPGWKSLIPFYSAYVLFGIAWKKSMFWATMAIVAVSSIVSNIFISSATQMAMLNRITTYSTIMMATSFFLLLTCAVLSLVIQIILSVHLSRAFGHGGGYAIGLILLPTIFMLILGLGNSHYQKKVNIRDEQTVVLGG